MRIALTALLAFAAGVLIMITLDHSRADLAGAAAPVAASSSDATDDSSDNPDWPNSAPTPEQVLYDQPAMLQRALDALSPRTNGHPNLYLLAFAGDGSEAVFRNEADYAAQLFAQRFGARGHTLVLENSPDTLATHPLASWSNLEAALDGLATKMDPSQDILVLYMTSHGSEDHTLLVDMDPLPLDQIGADDLGDILKSRPFKWKVVVVNACFSGGFVPALRAPGTLVLTAARSDRSSFGCGSDADITYFGKAWLVDALNRSDNFTDAFKLATGDITQWEAKDKLTASLPQIDQGSAIGEQLTLWRQSLTLGPAVPFKPATSFVQATGAATTPSR
ncbi:MAG: C13 family peptidase [Dyella sp.]